MRVAFDHIDEISLCFLKIFGQFRASQSLSASKEKQTAGLWKMKSGKNLREATETRILGNFLHFKNKMPKLLCHPLNLRLQLRPDCFLGFKNIREARCSPEYDDNNADN